jgi:hypothetical protein
LPDAAIDGKAERKGGEEWRLSSSAERALSGIADPPLVARGQTVTCMDVNPGAHCFADLGQVTSVRGGVAQFDEVMAGNIGGAAGGRCLNLSLRYRARHVAGILRTR